MPTILEATPDMVVTINERLPGVVVPRGVSLTAAEQERERADYSGRMTLAGAFRPYVPLPQVSFTHPSQISTDGVYSLTSPIGGILAVIGVAAGAAGVTSETVAVAPAAPVSAAPSVVTAAPGAAADVSFVGPATGTVLDAGVQASGAIVTPLAAQAPIEATALTAGVATGAGTIGSTLAQAGAKVATALASSALTSKLSQALGLGPKPQSAPPASTAPASSSQPIAPDGAVVMAALVAGLIAWKVFA